MDTNDPRQNAFSAARFRDGIQFAMKMGLPSDATERVTFKWTEQKTYDDADTRGNPYDFTDSPTSTVSKDDTVASLTLPVAVEFFSTRTSSGDTNMGDFDITKVKIIILDTEYPQINDENLGLPDMVELNGNTYVYDFEAPPEALFDVTVYSLFFTARDES